MWKDPNVNKEWSDAGEEQGRKVHLSRDPDGEAYLTQTEMMVSASVKFHSNSSIMTEITLKTFKNKPAYIFFRHVSAFWLFNVWFILLIISQAGCHCSIAIFSLPHI